MSAAIPSNEKEPLVDEKVYEMFRDYLKREDDLLNYRLTWLLTIHGFLYATCGFTLQARVEVVQRIASDFKSLVCHQSSQQFVELLSQRIPQSKIGVAATCDSLSPSIEQAYFGFSKLGFNMIEMDLFLFMIALIGLLVSVMGLYSIGAAKSAAQNVESIFMDQYDTKDINYRRISRYSRRVHIYPIRVVTVKVSGQITVLPTISGGGSPKNVFSGFTAPLRIPIILIIGWIVAMLIGLAYYITNRHFVFNIISGWIN